MRTVYNLIAVFNTAATLFMATCVDVKASSIEAVPGDVVRTKICNHLQVHEIVHLSLSSKAMRNVILGADNGKTSIRNSGGRKVIHLHYGELSKNIHVIDFVMPRKDDFPILYRRAEDLAAIFPVTGLNSFRWGTMVGIYKSVPTEHYAQFANCKSIGLAGLHELTDDDLKHFSNAVVVDLNGCWNITDEGIKYLKSARTLYLHGCKVTYKGLCQLEHLKVVYKFGYCIRKEITDTEQLNCRRLLKEKGVKIYG